MCGKWELKINKWSNIIVEEKVNYLIDVEIKYNKSTQLKCITTYWTEHLDLMSVQNMTCLIMANIVASANRSVATVSVFTTRGNKWTHQQKNVQNKRQLIFTISFTANF